MVKVGDRIRLSSGKGPDREGAVTAVVGSMVRVRWSSAGETTVIPAPGTLTVLASSGGQVPKKAVPKKAVPKKAATKTGAKKATTSAPCPRFAAGVGRREAGCSLPRPVSTLERQEADTPALVLHERSLGSDLVGRGNPGQGNPRGRVSPP